MGFCRLPRVDQVPDNQPLSDLLGGSEVGPPLPPTLPGFAKEGLGPEAAAVSLVPKGPFLSVLPHPPSRGEFHDSRNSLLFLGLF